MPVSRNDGVCADNLSTEVVGSNLKDQEGREREKEREIVHLMDEHISLADVLAQYRLNKKIAVQQQQQQQHISF